MAPVAIQCLSISVFHILIAYSEYANFFLGNFNAGLLVNGNASIARLATIVLSTRAEFIKIKNNNLSAFTSLQRVDKKKEGLDHSLGSA